ncbi:phosphatidate cytidylyltransferase [Desulfohalotomaculum tongense]|uniref:phosphatidate cytidylyltransferase n=1 Tax=Desulforadius tongensis TaxID=1216062 RepID=UPI001957BDC1|nr:phosphatidate cytidylyltransferase [Desulforadius tongensis]
MLHLRVLSALVGIPVIVYAAWHGGLLLLSVVGIIMVLGVMEMLNLLRGLNIHPSRTLALFGVLMLLAVVYLQDWRYIGIVLTILTALHLILLVRGFPEYTPADGAGGLFTTLYLSLLIYIYLISTLPQGKHWIFIMLVGTWASDTFAYFTGRAFGRHKLTPNLSPKKTWEGAIGGILGSMAAVYIYSILFNPAPPAVLILLGALISISSQVGDLVESALKRQAKIKDSGTIIPGHGGVLDRFDSMLLSAPLVYYFVSVSII